MFIKLNFVLAVSLINILIVTPIDGKYKVYLERAALLYFDEEYSFANGTTFKYNRTQIAMNQTWIVYKQYPSDTMVNIQTFEFLNNEYRPFAINSTKRYCDFLTTTYAMFYNDINNGHSKPIPPRCPVEPGSYSIINYTPNTEYYPFNLPFKRLMITFKLLLKERLLFHAQYYAEFDRDYEYREKYE